MSESNKDEANRCIEIAEKHIGDGNAEKAEKFLRKAERLYPTPKAKELLVKVAKMSEKPSENQPRKRHASSSKSEPQQPTSTPDYSQDQLEAVKRVKRCNNDYYEIIGVTKDATDSDIKKAYKKLALQLHPDKNKCPGAAEAFKAVGNAAAVLTDPEKRKKYDLFGSEAANLSSRSSGTSGTTQYTTHGFESDVTAEELFNMFFGGSFSSTQQNVFVRRSRWAQGEAHHSQPRHEQHNGYTAFVQMLPILLLIMLSMMSSLFISDPVYNLHVSQKFNIQRRTERLKVPYYVKETFHSEYQGSLRRLEASIEEEYLTNLRHACHREKNYRETMLWKARNFGDRDLYEKAQTIKTPSCSQLQELLQIH